MIKKISLIGAGQIGGTLAHLITIKELVNSRKPQYIVNFAAQGMVAESWKTPEHWYQTNVVAQVKLHERLKKLDFLKILLC